MNALSLRHPNLPRDRAGRLAYFKAREDARNAADPDYALKLAYAWADPDLLRRFSTSHFVNGRYVGLSDYHERLRRCYVLRAWLSVRLGWYRLVRENLFHAGVQRRLARGARKEGR